MAILSCCDQERTSRALTFVTAAMRDTSSAPRRTPSSRECAAASSARERASERSTASGPTPIIAQSASAKSLG